MSAKEFDTAVPTTLDAQTEGCWRANLPSNSYSRIDNMLEPCFTTRVVFGTGVAKPTTAHQQVVVDTDVAIEIELNIADKLNYRNNNLISNDNRCIGLL
jgi:hypothetical protein